MPPAKYKTQTTLSQQKTPNLKLSCVVIIAKSWTSQAIFLKVPRSRLGYPVVGSLGHKRSVLNAHGQQNMCQGLHFQDPAKGLFHEWSEMFLVIPLKLYLVHKVGKLLPALNLQYSQYSSTYTFDLCQKSKVRYVHLPKPPHLIRYSNPYRQGKKNCKPAIIICPIFSTPQLHVSIP